MPVQSPDPRIPFFNHLADHWDGWENLETLPGRLAAALAAFGIAPQERVLEVGCGTGNLTLALTRHLSEAGRIFAVDSCARMLEKARAKVQDPRVAWILAPVQELPADPRDLDRAILMGVWPHLVEKRAVLETLHGRLRPQGMLHIWHLASRERINQIHAGAHPAVAQDMLEPAQEIAMLLENVGFEVLEIQDDAAQHLVSARRT
jgi:ubiquinone/menaquinone biosynthesis C-methylase UbiE